LTIKRNISDENPGSILVGLAKTFDVDIEEKPSHCRISIPENHGSGKVDLYNFSHGISTILVSVKLNKALTLYYEDGKVHPLKIIILKDGYLNHAFDNDHSEHRVNSFESLIIASTPENNHCFKFPKDRTICFLSIQINRKDFENKIDDFVSDMHQDISKLFRDVNGVQNFNYKNFITPATLNHIEEFIENTDKKFLEAVFLEGLTYQLIVSNLRQYLVNLQSPKHENVIATKTRLKVKQATDFIEKQISEYTSVKDLAKTLSINEKTLQSGFKQIYNTTVTAYVRNYRASKARQLFETTDLSVAEIAYKLGVNSPNHLSKLFKLYYGLTPSAFKAALKK
tara:strand:+ start:5724 stop:6743 length:1020 start_codon:yes stop_codon:yes gene_type:complete